MENLPTACGNEKNRPDHFLSRGCRRQRLRIDPDQPFPRKSSGSSDRREERYRPEPARQGDATERYCAALIAGNRTRRTPRGGMQGDISLHESASKKRKLKTPYRADGHAAQGKIGVETNIWNGARPFADHGEIPTVGAGHENVKIGQGLPLSRRQGVKPFQKNLFRIHGKKGLSRSCCEPGGNEKNRRCQSDFLSVTAPPPGGKT